MTLLEVGRIGRAHGIKGELMVELVTDRLERLAPGSRLYTDRGELVVRSSRPHQRRHIVAFDAINDRAAAESFTGLLLRAEAIEDPDALWVHDLIGTRVVDREGIERGIVTAVLANPAHDLLELDNGVLVPIVFVSECRGGVTTVDPPAGLFDVL